MLLPEIDAIRDESVSAARLSAAANMIGIETITPNPRLGCVRVGSLYESFIENFLFMFFL
jgi:hypothetical protein